MVINYITILQTLYYIIEYYSHRQTQCPSLRLSEMAILIREVQLGDIRYFVQKASYQELYYVLRDSNYGENRLKKFDRFL